MPIPVFEIDEKETIFARNFYYTEDPSGDTEIGNEDGQAYYRALQRRPALAMICAKTHDLAVSSLGINAEKLALIIVNRPDVVGFQMMLHEDADQHDRDAFMAFYEELNDTALPREDIIRSTTTELFFGAQDESVLLDLLVTFAKMHDYDFNRWQIDEGYEGNFDAFHAQWGSDDQKRHRTWQEDAEDSLSMPWVMAALAEKTYPTRELLLKEVYRTRYLGIYSEDQIRNAIDTQKIVRKREDGWSCKFH